MHTELSLEQRVAALEEEVATLKRRLEELLPKKDENWIEKISGSMKDFPEWEEVARLGAEIRRADRPADDDE